MRSAVELDSRRVGVFGLQLLGFFALAVSLYPWLAPPYKKAIVGVTDAITAGFTPAVRLELLDDGGVRYFRRLPDGAKAQQARFDQGGLTFVGFNLVLLPALMLATPFPWRRRLRLLGLGLLLLLPLQLAVTIGWAKVLPCVRETPESIACGWLFYILLAANQVGAIVIWAAFTWRDLLPAGSRRPARNAPCPCGSGLKYKRCCAELASPDQTPRRIR